MFELSSSEVKLSFHLPPSHPSRLHPALVHAICAAASIYTDKIPPTKLPFHGRVPAHQLFPDSEKRLFNLPDTFAERHCRLAFKRFKESREFGRLGFSVGIVQAITILSITLRRLAKWAPSHGSMDGSVRMAALLHLNVGPGFESLSDDYTPGVRLDPAHSPKEEEARRNTFWACYAAERYYARMSSHPMSLDDEDVSQPLPLRGDLFEQGFTVPMSQRQFIHSPDLLSSHPPELTDSFVLMVKSAILVSRVRTFNRRFRKLNFLGVDDMCLNVSPSSESNTPTSSGSNDGSQSSTGSSNRTKTTDARQVDRFLKLENEVESFTRSFPAYLQEPITQDGFVDEMLFNTFLASHFAKISLHEPHADFKLNESDFDGADFTCESAHKVGEALDSAYHLFRTMTGSISDVTLADTYCVSLLYQCAAICVEIIQKSFRSPPTTEEEIIARPRAHKYWDRFQFMRSTLRKIGARLPQAAVNAILLTEMVRRLMDPKRRTARVSVD
ncbi:hypothetical protein SCHPADRAFT_393594 [Schizopora paradoxa]|uniref:Xylanolytic transcriptional activator regulatory domain-containing protein n=1 Tax=Schizopora paradoxa TaxID=27342 RepID=A0A0H2RLT3_9AGAM|nr:hypothetical protein SCHPADRAFT_393594 [Schizopora paradoxa]